MLPIKVIIIAASLTIVTGAVFVVMWLYKVSRKQNERHSNITGVVDDMRRQLDL